MHLQLLIPHAVWPKESEAAEVTVGLKPVSFSFLLGRGTRERFGPMRCLDWLAQSFGMVDFPAGPLTLAAEHPDAEAGYWLRADPVHLVANQFGACMADPRGLHVSPDEAVQLVANLNKQFAGDDMYFVVAAPDKWLLRLHEVPQVTFAELEAVFGNEDIGAFLPQGADAARWHRRLNEMQMLLYAHPVNDIRASLGQPLINSLWLWGGGNYPVSRDLQKPAELLMTSDPMIAALAKSAGCRRAPRPNALENVSASKVLVVLDDLVSPALWGDALTWRENWAMLDGDWLAPVHEWLSAGKISTLDLILPEAGLKVSLSRRDLLCLWRRPWLPW